MKSTRKFLAILLTIVLVLPMTMLASCKAPESSGASAASSAVSSGSGDEGNRAGATETWAFYFYLCGSDLESKASNGGWASAQIRDMLTVELPSNIEVIIQTGGSDSWAMDIDPNQRQIYHYGSDGLKLIESWEKANMGDPKTLIEFLDYCNTNYPADNRILVLWDHGGGTIGGVCYDEQYGKDNIILRELEYALAQTSKTADGSPLYELIGFDCCLMGTIDVAYIVSDYARYMVASEDLGRAIGYNYAALLQTIVDNPLVGGDEIGRVVCDTYYDSMKLWPVEQSLLTLSVIDLPKFKTLYEAYCDMGDELLVQVSRDPQLLGAYGRAAREAKNFFNSESTGYSCMVDLGDLVRKGQLEGLFPITGKKVLDALDDCVVYQIKGSEHENVTGLACYYNYPGYPYYTTLFLNVSENPGIKFVTQFITDGELSAEGIEYAKKVSEAYGGQVSEDEPIVLTSLDALHGYPLVLGPNGQFILDLGPELGSQLSAVYVTQSWVSGDYDDNTLRGLYGLSNFFPHDFENGIFEANFQNNWGALGELPVYMEPVGGDSLSFLYAAPVLINGVSYALLVSQDQVTGEWTLLGAVEPIDDETSRAGKDVYQLYVGDKVEAIMFMMFPDGEIDEETGSRVFSMPLGEITYEKDTVFRWRPVSGISQYDSGDWVKFIIMFVMIDYAGNTYYSDIGRYRVLNGKVEAVAGPLG